MPTAWHIAARQDGSSVAQKFGSLVAVYSAHGSAPWQYINFAPYSSTAGKLQLDNENISFGGSNVGGRGNGGGACFICGSTGHKAMQ